MESDLRWEWFKELAKQHPIEASIACAVHQRFLELRDLFTWYLNEPVPALADFTAKLEPVSVEISELMGWVTDPTLPLPLPEVIAMCDSLTKAYVEGGGKNVGEASEIIRSAALRKPPGRPAELRLAAVRGLEMNVLPLIFRGKTSRPACGSRGQKGT